MAQTLYELLNDCVVVVNVPALHSQGSGFFVASGLILTCAHVVGVTPIGSTTIEIGWQGQTFPASLLKKTDANGSDLALLQLSVSTLNHPCVLLQGGAEPFNNLYSYGYPDLYAQGASTTFQSEGWVGGQREFIKFQSGQARPGMSGSPILNLETGCVCGIIQKTRDRNATIGGLGLLAPAIYHEWPDLEEQGKQFHERDTRWLDGMTVQQRQRIGQLWQLSVSDSVKVFFSYAREDDELRKELAKQLKIMQRLNIITSWYEDDITAGGLKEEAVKQLNQASIILLLISTDFMNSDYTYEEMELALKRHDAGMARVIPIIMRSTMGWEQTPLGKLLAIPRNGKPVANWKPRDEGFYEVAKEIRRVVEDVKKPKQPH